MKKPMLALISTALALVALMPNATAQEAKDKSCAIDAYLHVGKHTLEYVEKRAICVRKNKSFDVKLVALAGYKIDRHKFSIEKKEPEIDWIKDVDITPSRIRIFVKRNVAAQDVNFKIVVAGVGELDPRVRIIENLIEMQSNLTPIEDTIIEEFGVNFSLLRDIRTRVREMREDLTLDDLADAVENTNEGYTERE